MRKALTLLALLTAILSLGIPALAGNGNQARVRVVHASPDAPPVDVIVNDGPRVFTDAPFTAVSGYESLDAGVYNVKVVPAGDDAPVVIDADVNVLWNTDYTIAAVGLLGDESIRPLVLEDDNRPVSQSKARVRFVHASPDAPAVDVQVTNGPVLFDDVEFTEAGDYVTVPADLYDLEVRLSDSGAVVLEVPGVMLQGGTTYTVFAMGLAAGTPELRAVASEDSFNPGRDRGRKIGLSRSLRR